MQYIMCSVLPSLFGGRAGRAGGVGGGGVFGHCKSTPCVSISSTYQGAAQQHMDPASAPPNSMVTIMIKNPNGSDQDFSLEVPLADTCVRRRPTRPPPSTRRLFTLTDARAPPPPGGAESGSPGPRLCVCARSREDI